MKDRLNYWFRELRHYWQSFTPLIRLGAVAGILGLLFISIVMISALLRPRVRVQQITKRPIATTATPTPTPTTETTTPQIAAVVPEKVVINSAQKALDAESFDDDQSVIIKRVEVSDKDMARIAINWLKPQQRQLNERADDLRASVENARQTLAENEPLVESSREELAQAEKDYKRANAAMDLPQLNSSFNATMDLRYQEALKNLEKSRKQLKIVEEAVAQAQKRIDSEKDILTEVEVEIANMQDRVDKIEAHDPKTLATTYEYAASGLRALPLLKFVGNSNWNVRYVKEIAVAYTEHFRRTLPISALGQSQTHNRLGWDHRNAADVAVRPDSKEGQWLVSYLRSRSIPFLAFRSAVAGHATGPHVHIGLPSHRLQR